MKENNIEEDVKYVKEMLEIARVFFKAVKAETDYKNVDEIAFCNALENILAEREQRDKRIQELEEENNKTQIISPYYVKENYIPKQAVIDKIKEVRSKRIKHEIDNKLLLDGVREKYLNNKEKFDSCELVTYCIHNEYLGEEHYLQELLEGEK